MYSTIDDNQLDELVQIASNQHQVKTSSFTQLGKSFYDAIIDRTLINSKGDTCIT